MSLELRSTLRRNLMTRRRFLTLALTAVPSISLANTVVLEQTALLSTGFVPIPRYWREKCSAQQSV
ncbi:MAG: hypothetical protein ABSG48_04625, partial [Geobacteraceae bacterium]